MSSFYEFLKKEKQKETEQKRIKDSAFYVRLVLTVLSMLSCLAAMSLSAYAFFTSSISSTPSTVQAASFSVTVTVDGTELPASGSSAPSYALTAHQTYHVVLAPAGTASTGFCVLTADGCGETYHSCQLGADTSAPGGSRASYEFDLIANGDTSVTFTPQWGTSVYYNAPDPVLYIQGENRTVSLSIAGGSAQAPELQQSIPGDSAQTQNGPTPEQLPPETQAPAQTPAETQAPAQTPAETQTSAAGAPPETEAPAQAEQPAEQETPAEAPAAQNAEAPAEQNADVPDEA